MAIPDTAGGWGLQDVKTELGLPSTAKLSDCFANAIAGEFDPLYEGSKDRLSNFRNYGDSPSSLSISPTAFGAVSGSDAFNLTITTNESWSYSDDVNWIAPSSSSGTGNAVLLISIADNTTGIERIGTITIQTTSGTKLTATCTVEQAAF